MPRLVDILKEAGKKFVKYELGLNEIKVWKELRKETTRLKAKYGFSDWDSYKAWRNDDGVSINDKLHFKVHLDDVGNVVRGLSLKYAISAAEIGLIVNQISPQISKGDYLVAAGIATIILGIGESLKGVVHVAHGDEYRTNNLMIDAFGYHTKTTT